MTSPRIRPALLAVFLLALTPLVGRAVEVPAGSGGPLPVALAPLEFDVRAFGAKGDGTTLDTDAINRAIAAASASGGGTVRFPAGSYLSYSIRLRSNLALYLDAGATILAAAQPAAGAPGYDPAEPNLLNGQDNVFQDYGHSHFHNSLIWGENVENVSILGPGRIYGLGLLRNGGNRPGQGNKAIALKLCRNVTLKDFTLLQAGWFSLLATGVDNLTIDGLRVDTNRDGFDIDCCRNVHVANCSVNSPQDDGICLKSTFALGFARPTENVTITNCQVSGYIMGTFLDGTYRANGLGGTGRIKFGTESNGGFRNITISNCVFDHCNGLALEAVDGGIIEDVTISNLAMRHIANAPVFVRLGHRMRGPEGTPIGIIRRVSISGLVASDVAGRSAMLIAGTAGHPIEDLRLTDIRISFQGGGTAAQADNNPPEDEPNFYPEPGSFGILPSYGLFARHVTGLTARHVEVSFVNAEQRPPVILDDVAGVTLDDIVARRTAGAPLVMAWGVHDLTARSLPGLADAHLDAVGATPEGQALFRSAAAVTPPKP